MIQLSIDYVQLREGKGSWYKAEQPCILMLLFLHCWVFLIAVFSLMCSLADDHVNSLSSFVLPTLFCSLLHP